jgi:glycosyltransferase involved in cell wall biosynthesis
MADYAREQAAALCDEGAEVTVLCTNDWPRSEAAPYKSLPILSSSCGPSNLPRWQNQLRLAATILANQSRLARVIRRGNFRQVLGVAYSEYLSPLWAGRLKHFSRQGVVFGAVVHDPVRDYVVGPLWWHRRSVAAGYSYLREAFVHEPVRLDTIDPVPMLTTTVIPHGSLAFPPATLSAQQMRAQLGIPLPAKVLLSFGYIRDSKNLDLVLQAIRQFPEVYLLVAGTVSTDGQRSVESYQALAKKLGVADRCRWFSRFLPREEIGNFFAAADLVLLTYSKSFRSASGVVNTAIFYRKPCLASSGPGNLCSVVQKYGLGIWVEPDDLNALKVGMERWRTDPPIPRWEAYEEENSWQRNAALVVSRFKAGCLAVSTQRQTVSDI